MAEGSGSRATGFIPGPEGPAGAAQKRQEYEEAMARLNEPEPAVELTDRQKAQLCIDDLKLWIGEHGIDASELEALLVQDVVEERKALAARGRPNEDPSTEDSKTSMLIDLMAKNRLQNKCDNEMVLLLEQISLENREAVDQNFSRETLSKKDLSKGAQRQLDKLLQIFKRTGSGPRVDFVHEIETQVNTAMLETLFYQSKTKQVQLKVDAVLKPRWDQKLCLRDTLQRIYDADVSNQQRELSLRSLKMQQEARQKLSNLREAQAEANEAAAATGDSVEQLKQSIGEIQILSGQQQLLEDQILSMQMVIDKEFAGLDPDISKARKQLALLRDELIAKEEAAAKSAQ